MVISLVLSLLSLERSPKCYQAQAYQFSLDSVKSEVGVQSKELSSLERVIISWELPDLTTSCTYCSELESMEVHQRSIGSRSFEKSGCLKLGFESFRQKISGVFCISIAGADIPLKSGKAFTRPAFIA